MKKYFFKILFKFIYIYILYESKKKNNTLFKTNNTISSLVLASVAGLMVIGPYLLIPIILVLLGVGIVGVVEALLIVHQLFINNCNRF